jgi:hypothetical protein
VRLRQNDRRLNYGLLAGREPPPPVTPEDESDDLAPWLAPLRERFPVPTILDDD